MFPERLPRVPAALFVLVAAQLAGCSGQQSATNPQGPVASEIAWFFWGMVFVGGLILAGVMAVLAASLIKGRRGGEARPLTDRQSHRLVLVAGLMLPAIILLVFILASASVDRAVAQPPEPAITVEVIGHQWWWEVNYLDANGSRIANTANELHVPVGQPVRLLLKSADVIHSFWVPNLHGKTDLIPGQTNTSWFQADKAGVYRGQCSEFCGRQHAFMAFVVVAAPEAEFQRWLAHQRAPAAAPETAAQRRGQEVFLTAPCAMCHSIRGTPALAQVAPDLTHFASRQTLAAGTFPNSRGHLAGWILNPQHLKPGTHMPPTQLAPADLNALLDYLESLR